MESIRQRNVISIIMDILVQAIDVWFAVRLSLLMLMFIVGQNQQKGIT